jgi:glycosyltransferase involved in cell wall biosynthesis
MVRQTSVVRRVLNWAVFSAWLVLALGRDWGADRELVVVSHPPFLVDLVWAVCALTGWKYTYVVHDHYPDAAVELGYISRDGLVHRAWEAVNRRAIASAKYVVTLGPAMRDRVAASVGDGLDPERMVVIHNWERNDIEPRPKSENWFARKHGLVDTFTVLYSGSISVYHDLETLVRAARRLEDVRVLVVGEGERKDHVVRLAERLGVAGDTVRFLPFVPTEDLPYSLTACDVSVVTVQSGFEGVNVSGKLYTSLAAGRPVLVIAHPEDDESRLVESFDAGTHVEQGDVDGVVEAVRRWRSDPELAEEQGRNAATAFETRFTKERALDEYYALLTRGPSALRGGDTVPEPAAE